MSEWRRVCGERITGMFTAFPCCLDPGHDGDHMFAAYHAAYRIEEGLMYEREGKPLTERMRVPKEEK